MIIILGKNATYSLDQDFPIFNVPTGMDGATTQSLSDFQWWAYSSDFQKWLKENPRQWTADSENMTKYGSLEDFIKENFNHTQIVELKDGVMNFEDYLENDIFEAEDKTNDAGTAVKFNYAYNKLLSEGKIKTQFVVAEQKEGEEKAIFLSLDDEKKEEILGSLAAYKVTELPTSPNSKMALFRVSEILPGGKVTDEDTPQTLLEKSFKVVVQSAAYSGAALAAYYILATSATGYFGWRQYKKILQKLSPAKPGAKIAALRKLAKRNKSIKGFMSAINPMKIVRSAKGSAEVVGKAFAKGSKWFSQSRKMGGTLTQAIKAFGRGTTKGFAEAGTKAIPVVGWALAAIDVIGSTWNWFSDNQAPLYDEVKSFAKNEFIAKDIPVGIPIVVCWSQEAGGAWRTVVNFISNNDTRTTMELVKVGDFDGKSIFILTQINSKEMAKQLAEHDLTLLAFTSSEKVKTTWYDNDDLDFEIATVDGLDKLSVMYNFKGVCDWTELNTTYEASSDRLLIADPGAPETYKFYFEDTEGEKINVSGKLLSDDQIAKLSDTDLQDLFSLPSATSESLDQELEWDREVLESQNILSFEAFSEKAFSMNEEDEADAETGGETEESGNLKPSQQTGPKKLAVYVVEEKEYANPELRGKSKPGDFTDFVVNPDFWKVSDGTKIEVLVNTDEMLEDTIKGVYTYEGEGKEVKGGGKEKEEEKGDIEPKPERKGDDEEEEGKKLPDDYYITASPDDIRIKQRERATTIRDFDFSGGLNLFDKFLTPRQKEILGIDNWKTITFAKEFYDKRGDIIEVKFKNRYAPFGERTKKYRVTDGESFEIAKKFVEETKERIKYE